MWWWWQQEGETNPIPPYYCDWIGVTGVEIEYYWDGLDCFVVVCSERVVSNEQTVLARRRVCLGTCGGVSWYTLQ